MAPPPPALLKEFRQLHRRSRSSGSTFSLIFILGCGGLILLLAVVNSPSGSSGVEASRIERNSTESFRRVTRDRRRYCGKALTDMLSAVCSSFPSLRKKAELPSPSSGEDASSYEGTYRDQLIDEIKQDLDELEQLAPEMFSNDLQPSQFHPFYPRSYQPRQHQNQHRRVRRQIVDECCRKSCTLKTLKQYCAD